VSFDRVSITDRITQLMEKLAGKASCRFEDLFDGQRSKFELIVTFLALLEMTRLRMTRLYQPDPLSDIFIETAMVGADAAAPEVPEPSV
jgi:segregation and condensation protein A